MYPIRSRLTEDVYFRHGDVKAVFAGIDLKYARFDVKHAVRAVIAELVKPEFKRNRHGFAFAEEHLFEAAKLTERTRHARKLVVQIAFDHFFSIAVADVGHLDGHAEFRAVFEVVVPDLGNVGNRFFIVKCGIA